MVSPIKIRLRVVPHFSSGIAERAKRERAWKSHNARKVRRGGEGEKWGTADQAFDPSRPTDFGVWSLNPLPNQLSASNGIPSLIKLSLLLSSVNCGGYLLQAKGGISYIAWCIASYYIIKLPNARDAISSTRTWQLNSSGERLVLPIKLSVPLLCRSIYDFRFTIPNISLVKSKRVFWPPIIS